MTLGIWKVIFCKLMSVFILCQTKYCAKQTSEMVLFVTITIANVVFYWAMVLHVQFLFITSLFFCVSLWLIPSRSEVATRAVL